MACPYVRRAGESLQRQSSVVGIDSHAPWNLEEELTEILEDALTLTHLNAAIQLLTAPTVKKLFHFHFLVFFCV